MLTRVIALILSYVLFLAIIAGIAALILPQLVKSVSDLGNSAKSFAESVLHDISGFLDKIPFLPEETKLTITELLDFDVLVEKLVTFLQKQLDKILGKAPEAASGGVGVGATVSTIVGFVKKGQFKVN